jgi:hypothetical protein
MSLEGRLSFFVLFTTFYLKYAKKWLIAAEINAPHSMVYATFIQKPWTFKGGAFKTLDIQGKGLGKKP